MRIIASGSREHLTQIEHLEGAIEGVTAEIVRRLTPPPEEGQSCKPEEDAKSQQPASSKLEVGVEASQTQQPVESQQIPPAAPKVTVSWAQAVMLLSSIPGISVRAACAILAEIGTNMQQFPTAGHLASWAGVCPGNHESEGLRLSGKTRKGHPWLRRLADPGGSCSGTQEELLVFRPSFTRLPLGVAKSVPRWR